VICGATQEPSPSTVGAFLDVFLDAMAEYLRELRRRGMAATTIDKARRDVESLGLFLASLPRPPKAIGDVTVELVSAYRDHEMTRQRRWRGEGCLSAATVRRQVAVLRGFFRHLTRRGVLLVDPALDLVGPRRLRTLPREVPTVRQMKSLLSASDESELGKRDRAVLELLYSSGLRNAELCSLTMGDLDLTARTVYVRKGKGGHERLVPVGRKAASALADYLSVYEVLAGRSHGTAPAREAPLFLNRVGRSLNPETVRRLVRRQLDRSRQKVKATPHSLRHACATHLLKGGAGIRQIQALLGHQRLDSTQVYTRVVTTDLRAMLDRHHPRGRPDGR
jgi:site-specific recombinase XerD